VLHVLVHDLEERDRELLRLKYVEGMTYGEMAEQTEMSAGNVGWRLHHILKNLADALRRLGVEGSQG
jgi:RNA polymerase sigma-70 factor (ECF subfamily)